MKWNEPSKIKYPDTYLVYPYIKGDGFLGKELKLYVNKEAVHLDHQDIICIRDPLFNNGAIDLIIDEVFTIREGDFFEELRIISCHIFDNSPLQGIKVNRSMLSKEKVHVLRMKSAMIN